MYYRYRFPRQMQQEFDRFQRQANQMFGYAPRRRAASYPAVNLWANDEDIIATAELPGFSADDINITVVNDTLTVSGERKAEELPENGFYHRQECPCGKFSRTMRLPFRVDADQVEAIFENGVLKISLTRAEEDKPRKINIKAG